MKNASGFLHRRSIRLQGYDYSQEGMYFITIGTHEKKCLFGYIRDHEMILNPYGKIANTQWQLLPERFPNISNGPFIIMPNHIHGIIIVRATLAIAHDSDDPGATAFHDPGATARVAPTIGRVVGAYKSLVVYHYLKYIDENNTGITMGKIWQRNYYERIIRNENAYDRISSYIINNPVKWGN